MSPRFPVRTKIRLPLETYREGHCFFITITAQDRHPWFAIHPPLADEMVGIIELTSPKRSSQLFAWCVMPDHLHLLAIATDIIAMVRSIKGRVTPVARRFDSHRKLWQRSFYDHGLRREESVEQVAIYIFENPIRKDLVERPNAYRWSGSNVWHNWRNFFD